MYTCSGLFCDCENRWIVCSSNLDTVWLPGSSHRKATVWALFTTTGPWQLTKSDILPSTMLWSPAMWEVTGGPGPGLCVDDLTRRVVVLVPGPGDDGVLLQRQHLQLEDVVGGGVGALPQPGPRHVEHAPALVGVDHQPPLEHHHALDLRPHVVLGPVLPHLGLVPLALDGGLPVRVFEGVLDLDELADEGVEQHDLVVVGVGRRELVVLAELEVHHEPLQGGVHLPRQVRGHHVEGDELVADTDDVSEEED